MLFGCEIINNYRASNGYENEVARVTIIVMGLVFFSPQLVMAYGASALTDVLKIEEDIL
jgi:hypothetical protein